MDPPTGGRAAPRSLRVRSRGPGAANSRRRRSARRRGARPRPVLTLRRPEEFRSDDLRERHPSARCTAVGDGPGDGDVGGLPAGAAPRATHREQLQVVTSDPEPQPETATGPGFVDDLRQTGQHPALDEAQRRCLGPRHRPGRGRASPGLGLAELLPDGRSPPDRLTPRAAPRRARAVPVPARSSPVPAPPRRRVRVATGRRRRARAGPGARTPRGRRRTPHPEPP